MLCYVCEHCGRQCESNIWSSHVFLGVIPKYQTYVYYDNVVITKPLIFPNMGEEELILCENRVFSFSLHEGSFHSS